MLVTSKRDQNYDNFKSNHLGLGKIRVLSNLPSKPTVKTVNSVKLQRIKTQIGKLDFIREELGLEVSKETPKETTLNDESQ